MSYVNTKCEKCCFKIKQENQQIGCKLNVDQILGSNFPGIYSIDNIDKNNDNWTIKNFRCPYARTDQWLEILDKQQIDPDTYIYDNTKIGYYLVIIVESVENIQNLLEDIQKLSDPPKMLSLILSSNIQRKNTIIQKIEKYKLSKWKIHFVLDELTVPQKIDIALSTNIDNSGTNYIIIRKNIETIDNEYISSINDTVNFLIDKQAIIQGYDDFDGFVIPSVLYEICNKKIQEVVEYIEQDESIYKIVIT
jgi:hypothetical protein